MKTVRWVGSPRLFIHLTVCVVLCRIMYIVLSASVPLPPDAPYAPDPHPLAHGQGLHDGRGHSHHLENKNQLCICNDKKLRSVKVVDHKWVDFDCSWSSIGYG